MQENSNFAYQYSNKLLALTFDLFVSEKVDLFVSEWVDLFVSEWVEGYFGFHFVPAAKPWALPGKRECLLPCCLN